MRTSSSVLPTVGIEEEYFLVDTESLQLAPRSADVIAHAQAAGLNVEPELTKYQIETNSPPMQNIRYLHEHLIETRRTLSAISLAHESHLVALGMSATPVPHFDSASVSDTPRYHGLAESYGALAYTDPSCGSHVHVELPDKATALSVGNHLRQWLPTLVALTANSAVHDGADTGHASWRSTAWGRWPTAGPPPFVESVEHYDDLVGAMIRAGTIRDEANLYWDVRPSSHQPTIEIRVSDVPIVADETVLLAALIRALVLTAQWSDERGEKSSKPQEHHLAAAYHCARIFGISGKAIDPTCGKPTTARAMVDRLVRHAKAALEYTGDRMLVQSLLQRLDHLGNGAQRQQRVFAQTGSAEEVMLAAVRATTADSLVLRASGLTPEHPSSDVGDAFANLRHSVELSAR